MSDLGDTPHSQNQEESKFGEKEIFDEEKNLPFKIRGSQYNPQYKFTKKALEIDEKTAIYELKYFESGLWKQVEDLLDEEVYIGGSIRVKR